MSEFVDERIADLARRIAAEQQVAGDKIKALPVDDDPDIYRLRHAKIMAMLTLMTFDMEMELLTLLRKRAEAVDVHPIHEGF